MIDAAHRLGGEVVLGGHSLGGAIVTAYATWEFGGRAGADGLAGLVYDDGGSFGSTISAAAARGLLATLDAGTPWLAFSGVPAPLLGIFSAVGSTLALIAPDQPSLAQSFAFTPAVLKPPVAATNLATFGYDTDVATSKLSFAAQAHARAPRHVRQSGRLVARGRDHPDRPLRDDAVGRRPSRRGRQRVVLPAAPDR